MHVLVLLALIVAGFALDQAWNRHRVRAYYAALGREVLEIHWRPWVGFLSARLRRGDTAYHVVHAGPDGEARRSLCVTAFWVGVRLDENLQPDSRPTRSPAPARPGARGGRAATAREVAFWAPCAATAVATCLAVGVSYWSTPYGSVNLPDALYVPGFALVPAGAFALAAWHPRRTLFAVASQTAAVVAVVALRIAADVARDPTTHNLLPFEILIAVAVGGVAAGVGGGIARLGRRLTQLRGST